MSDLDREEEAVLESARRALTPSPAVTNRMRTALLAKLATPAAAAAAVGVATSATGAAATAALVEGVADSAAVASGAGTLAAGAKGALSAGALATGAKVAVSVALLKTAAGVATAAMLATAGGYYWAATETAPGVATPPPSAAPVSVLGKRVAPVHGNVVASAPPQRERTGVQATQPPTSAGSEAAPVIAVPHVAPNAGSQQLLQGELDVLKRVRQALQIGDAQLALGLLAKLDAEHPVSPLWQEREVARVLALCGAGRVTAARQAAQRLLGPNPNSLYAERIQASCAATSTQEPVPANAPASGRPAESTKSTKVAPPVARFGDPGN